MEKLNLFPSNDIHLKALSMISNFFGNIDNNTALNEMSHIIANMGEFRYRHLYYNFRNFIAGNYHRLSRMIENNSKPWQIVYFYQNIKFLYDVLIDAIAEIKRYIGQNTSLEKQIDSFMVNLDELLKNIENLYVTEGFQYNYFFFVNPQSAYYRIYADGVSPTFDTFEIGTFLNNEQYDDILNSRKQRFFVISPRSVLGLTGFQNVLGWRKDILLKSLLNNGVFKYVTENKGQFKIFDFMRLNELGIAKPKRVRINQNMMEHNGEGYPALIWSIPKYVLETLYHFLISSNINWTKLCNSDRIDAASLQYLAKRSLKLDISGDKEQTCEKLLRLELIRGSREEIVETAPALIMQPGGVHYMKYVRPGGEMGSSGVVAPELRTIDINRYYQDMIDICEDTNATAQDAFIVAEELGILDQINMRMNKEQACRVIMNYIQLLRESRKL